MGFKENLRRIYVRYGLVLKKANSSGPKYNLKGKIVIWSDENEYPDLTKQTKKVR